MHNGRLPRLCHSEDGVLAVGEYPNVMINSLNVYDCLVSVNKRAFQKPPNSQFFGLGIVTPEISHEIDQRRRTHGLIEQILHFLDDDTVREAKHYPFINNPGTKGVTKAVTPKFQNLRREKALATPRAVALRSGVFSYNLATSGP
jgi:hypothetical protein